MKLQKIILLTFFLSFGLISTSCGEDNDTDIDDTVKQEESLYATWILISEVDTENPDLILSDCEKQSTIKIDSINIIFSAYETTPDDKCELLPVETHLYSIEDNILTIKNIENEDVSVEYEIINDNLVLRIDETTTETYIKTTTPIDPIDPDPVDPKPIDDPSLAEEEVAITTGFDANITGFWKLIRLSYNSESITGQLDSDASDYIINIISTNQNGVLNFLDHSGEFVIKDVDFIFTSLPEFVDAPRFRVREGIASLANDKTNPDNVISTVITRITENFLVLTQTDDKGANNRYTFQREAIEDLPLLEETL